MQRFQFSSGGDAAGFIARAILAIIHVIPREARHFFPSRSHIPEEEGGHLAHLHFLRSLGDPVPAVVAIDVFKGLVIPAQWIRARSGSQSFRGIEDLVICAVSRTSAHTKQFCGPKAAAAATPRSSDRSAITTDTPRAASCRAQARPRPDAAPVTTAERFASFMKNSYRIGKFAPLSVGRTRWVGRYRVSLASRETALVLTVRPSCSNDATRHQLADTLGGETEATAQNGLIVFS